MIVLQSAYRRLSKGKTTIPILTDASFAFDLPRVGLASSNRDVLEVLLDLMAGYIKVERGMLRRFGRVSWPLGRIVQFRSELSGPVTLRFFCDIYGLDFRKTELLIHEIIDFKDLYRRPMSEWPNALTLELSYVTYLIPEFDIYLAEGSIGAGDDEFMKRWKPLFEKRIEGKQFIFAGEYAHRLSPYVEKVVVAEGGKLSLYDSVDAAFLIVNRTGAPASPRVDPAPIERQEADTNEMLF